MSITLPYASAVNCKFVALPDSLATDDNTLKLYNIDGGGGGGTTDAYTKGESDARFLRLSTSTNQTITGEVTASSLRSGQFVVNDGAFTTTITQNTGKGSNTLLKLPRMASDSEFLVNNPFDPQTVSIFNINNSLKIRDSSSLYQYTIRGGDATSNRGCTIPDMAGDSEFIMTKPTTGQTINNSLTLTGAVTATGFGTNGSVRISDVTIMNSNVSGAKNIFIPNLGASNGKFIVSDGATGQVINTLLNVKTLGFLGTADTFNRGVNVIATADETTTGTIASSSAVCNWTKNYAVPKTDLVTTVTGDSDSKVPSEKAVKTYVDSSSTSSSADYTLTLNTQDANSVWPDNLPVTIGKIGLMRIVTIKNSYAQGTQASYSLKKWNLPNSWSTSVLQEHVIMSQSTGTQNPIVMGTIFVTGNTLNVLIGAGNNTRTSTAFSFPLTNFSN